MATDAAWGRRLRAARRAYEERHDRSLTYREIGEMVGARLKRAPFAHPTVRAWFVDGQEPESFAVARALAGVLEADAGSLITGENANEPAEVGGLLEDYTAGAVALTPAQIARAIEKADAKAADRAASKTAPRAGRRKNGGR